MPLAALLLVIPLALLLVGLLIGLPLLLVPAGLLLCPGPLAGVFGTAADRAEGGVVGEDMRRTVYRS